MTRTRTAILAMGMAMTMFGSQAMAEEIAPLAPGKPAGVEQAQRHRPNLILIGAAATVVVIAVVVATQSSTPTCGTACNSTVVAATTT